MNEPIEPQDQALNGVVEGFYGPPWTQAQRLRLFSWLREFGGLSTYLYAPKDDLKHRQRWREPYEEGEARALRELINACGTHGLRFVYAIAPGLDISCAAQIDRQALFAKIEQLCRLGCRDFALLFDDVPAVLGEVDQRRFGSAGRAHAHVNNSLADHLRQVLDGTLMLFCPTVYCSRQADFELEACPYLQDVGSDLDPSTRVLWTGPEVISTEISVEHIRNVQKVLRHPLVLWDNLFANDYDLHRAFMGPFAGREPGLDEHLAGILLNPNCELALNYVPLHSFASFLNSQTGWREEQSYEAATAAWHAHLGDQLSLDELRLLSDCFHLPHRLGRRARDLLQAGKDADWSWIEEARREAEDLYWRLAALEDRDLYHSLRRYAWELWAGLRKKTAQRDGDENLPNTDQGAFVARLLLPRSGE